MADLYMMRHGQTLFNLRHMIQGWCDAPLTELGIGQARVAGEYFKNKGITFDHAYSSTAERACDTLELVCDMPYERVKGLKEMNFGKYEGQSEAMNPPLPYLDFFKKYAGGESQDEVQERMVKTVGEIMAQEGHESVLIVTLAAIRELAGFLDADGVEGILNELVSYELSDEKAEQVSAMRKALQQLDWDFLGGV
ncbi:MAG: histidine phosphatase family protein [Lachnospiraceae bacterium]|nr:histidine phosphatase family protein [Lachnospiraceae bacterium]